MNSVERFYRTLLLTLDLIAVVFSYAIASVLVKIRLFEFLGSTFYIINVTEAFALLVLAVLWFVSTRMTGLYQELRIHNFVSEFWFVLKNFFIQILTATVLLFVLKDVVLSRFFLGLYALSLFFVLFTCRLVLRIFLLHGLKKGRYFRRLLIIGANPSALSFRDYLHEKVNLGYSVAGILADNVAENEIEGHIGGLDKLAETLKQGNVDEVVVALTSQEFERSIDEILSVCEEFPVHLKIIPDYGRFSHERFRMTVVGKFPILIVRSDPLSELHWRFVKRSFDILFSLSLFIFVFWWFWPIIALAIKINSKGPVFFKQERWGRSNKKIICYKFRSMARESKDIDESGKYMQASRTDDRVTRVGRFLRKSSIDELPQFINVLRGEMSIVGPRPHPTPLNIESMGMVAKYSHRHLVKPGITGWAQVNGFRGETRNHDEMIKRVEHDLWYIENWTFLLDIQIVFLTIWRMIKGDPNAY